MNSLIKGTMYISDLAILAPTHLSSLLIDFTQVLCELKKGEEKKRKVFTSLASSYK